MSSENINDDLKSEAFLIYQEFGPARRIPPEKRIGARFPQFSETQIAALIQELESIEKTIWKIAEEDIPKGVSQQEIAQILSRSFPFLNQAALGTACNRVGYYAWHEGYFPKTK